MSNPIWSQENTIERFNNPKVGDHFSEMASFHMFVVHVSTDLIIVCVAKAPCTFPKDASWETYSSLQEFKNKYSYNKDGERYWVRFQGNENGIEEWLEEAPKIIVDQIYFLEEYQRQKAFGLCDDVPFGWLP